VTADGFLCLPLLLDPEIARDLDSRPVFPDSASSPVGETLPGEHFLPAVRLASVVEGYPLLWPDSYRELKEAVCRELDLPATEEDPGLHGWLAPLVFEVLPHFVRLGPAASRGPLGPEAVLAALARRLQVPPLYYDRARAVAAPEELARRLETLEKAALPLPPPPQGWVSGVELDHWLGQALRAFIIREERQTLARRLEEYRRQGETRLMRLALLLFLKDRGELEIDGFGITPYPGSAGDYWVYRRTGEYALRDYYGRPYLFPDCRVAVSTRERLRPVVLETYKHPLLRRHAPRQEICLPQEYQAPLTKGPREIIAALEAGLNALYYGYNPRRRNGYHSLDRHRTEQLISFEEYRLAPEDPRLRSGRVEVKNQFV